MKAIVSFFVAQKHIELSQPKRSRIDDDAMATIEKSKNSFNVYRTLWAPRAKFSESGDVFDSVEVEMARFNNDCE